MSNRTMKPGGNIQWKSYVRVMIVTGETMTGNLACTWFTGPKKDKLEHGELPEEALKKATLGLK